MRNATLGAARQSSVQLRIPEMRFVTLASENRSSGAKRSLSSLPSMPPLTSATDHRGVQSRSRSPDERATGRATAARTASSVPATTSRVRARVIAV